MSDVSTIRDFRSREAAAKAPRATSFADHALVQLTLVRLREFLREPEALFWVFIFPVLLAAGLGIAFRNRPAEILKIAAVTPQLLAGDTAEHAANAVHRVALWRHDQSWRDTAEFGRQSADDRAGQYAGRSVDER